jgi:hypothetical protein
VRVEGWNRAAADNAALAEAHGGWKPGNASRYSRFQLADVFTIFPKMVSSGPTDVPMVACWPAEDTPSDDGLVEEEEDVEDLDDEDIAEELAADKEDKCNIVRLRMNAMMPEGDVELEEPDVEFNVLE